MKLYAAFVETCPPGDYGTDVLLVGVYESFDLADKVTDQLYEENPEWGFWVEEIELNNTCMNRVAIYIE